MEPSPPPSDSAKTLPYLQVGAGVMIGILLMVFFQAFFAPPREELALPPPDPTAQQQVTTAGPESPANSPSDPKLVTPGTEAKTAQTPGTPAAGAAPVPAPGTAPAQAPVAATPPPGVGSPAPMQGTIGGGPLTVEPLSPTVSVTPTAPPGEVAGPSGASLTEVDLGGSGEAVRGRIEAEVRKHKGTVRALEVEGKRSLLVFVPAERTEAVLKAAGGRVTSRWSGSSEDRRARLTGDAARRVADLESRRKSLLLRYFEDAIPVREVDEALEQAKAELRRLSPPASADGMAAIHFALGD